VAFRGSSIATKFEDGTTLRSSIIIAHFMPECHEPCDRPWSLKLTLKWYR